MMQAPAAHCFSLVLQRPGLDRLPSLLGIGHHPSAIIPDPSKIQYSMVVGDEDGVLFWSTYIRVITVYVGSLPMPVTIPQSAGLAISDCGSGFGGTAYYYDFCDREWDIWGSRDRAGC